MKFVLDPYFLYKMGCIKPKTISRYIVSLNRESIAFLTYFLRSSCPKKESVTEQRSPNW
jgi:hypothetical protein